MKLGDGRLSIQSAPGVRVIRTWTAKVGGGMNNQALHASVHHRLASQTRAELGQGAQRTAGDGRGHGRSRIDAILCIAAREATPQTFAWGEYVWLDPSIVGRTLAGEAAHAWGIPVASNRQRVLRKTEARNRVKPIIGPISGNGTCRDIVRLPLSQRIQRSITTTAGSEVVTIIS